MKIKFNKMTNQAALQIPQEDLSAHAYGSTIPPRIDLNIIQQEELPSEVNVVYTDYDYDYNQMTQSSKGETAEVGQNNAIPIPIAMSKNQAKALADLIKFEAYSKQMRGFKFNLNNDYAKLEAGDVISIPVSNDHYVVRITKKDHFNGVMAYEADRHIASVYTQSAQGSAFYGFEATYINNVPPTELFFMDIPILSDEDNDYGVYVALAGQYEGWVGAHLFNSMNDGADYQAIGSFQLETITGYTQNVLGNHLAGNVLDTINYIDVMVRGGTLSSVTFAQMYEGQNACVVGADERWEILSFQSAELIGDGRYRLRNLLRGQRGTEQHMASHTLSDAFVLIEPETWQRILKGDNNIGTAGLYKPVSYGDDINQTSVYQETNQGNGLKPYSPVKGYWGVDTSGNKIIQWVRRTRVNGAWKDAIEVSLGEQSLVFDLVFTTLTGEVKRTVEVYAEEYVYGDYAADFPSNDGKVLVYQKSALVGRGFPLEIILQ